MKFITFRTALLTTIATILPFSSAYAQTPEGSQHDLKPGQTEVFLKTTMSSVLDSCLGGNADMRKDAKEKLVAVPKRLSKFVSDRSWNNYWQYGTSNVAAFLGYAFSKEEIENSKFRDKITNYLASDYSQNLQSLLQVKVSGDQYFEQTCGGAFKAAVSAGGGLGDLFKAAGRAAVNGKQQSNSEVAAGKFLSPFDPSSLAGSESRDQQFMLYLSFWDWRTRVGPQEGYLYKELTGLALRTYSAKSTRFDVNGKASGGLSIPFLSFKAKTEGGVSGEQSFEEHSAVFIFTEEPSKNLTHYFKIPNVADINSAIKSNANISAKIVGDASRLNVGASATVEMNAPWLPKKHCQTIDDYRVENVQGGIVSLIYAGKNNNGLGCQFRLSFDPNNTAISSGRGSLSFDLKRQPTFAGNAIEGFTLPVKPIAFTLNNAIRVVSTEKANMTLDNKLVNNIYQFQWQLKPILKVSDGFKVDKVRAVDVTFDDGCILDDINLNNKIQSELETLSQSSSEVKLRWTIGVAVDFDKLAGGIENNANSVCFMKGSYLIDSGAESYELPINPDEAILIVPDKLKDV